MPGCLATNSNRRGGPIVPPVYSLGETPAGIIRGLLVEVADGRGVDPGHETSVPATFRFLSSQNAA